jgi:hypothetical protein
LAKSGPKIQSAKSGKIGAANVGLGLYFPYFREPCKFYQNQARQVL